MRIHVTGNAASGKTSLATRLGRELRLPVFSLDNVVWQPGWRKTPPAERLAREQALVAAPEWIIEGVSPLVREHAEWVVFLDVPRRICAFRGVVRALSHFHRTRPGMPHACPEIAIVPRLLLLIYRFPQRARADILAARAREPARFRIQQRRAEFAELVAELKSARARAC